MRIVQMNCVFGQGSTGKIVSAIHGHLKERGDESFVLYGMGPKSGDGRVVRIVPPPVRKVQSLRSRVTGYPYGGCQWGTARAIRVLDGLHPDLVHLHCINGYTVNVYRVLGHLKGCGIPTVITNHAEFMYTGGCTHALDCGKWLTGCGGCQRLGKEHPISWFFDRTAGEWERLREAYRGFGSLTVCCVSDWLRDRAAKSPFFEGCEVLTVFNGLDTGTFAFRDARLPRGLRGWDSGRRLVIHVTPGFGSAIKGGSHVLEMARRMPEADFVVVGDPGGGAAGAPPNVLFVGRVEDQAFLAEYYSAADACLLTSKKETFSMVTAESLCCGTPVVGFEAGGPESIAIPRYGSFVEQGDDDALESALREALGRRIDKRALSAEATARYGQRRMCEEYVQIYERVIAGRKAGGE